jgi:hypothetical protein
LMNAPLSFSLEIQTQDDTIAESIAELLNTLIPGILGQLSVKLKKLKDFKIISRSVNDKIYIDIYFNKIEQSELSNFHLSIFNSIFLNFNSQKSVELGFGIKITDILTSSIDNLLEGLMNFNIKGNLNMNNVISLAKELIKQITKVDSKSKYNDFIKYWGIFLSLLSSIKKSHTDIQYDPFILINLVKDLVNLYKPLGKEYEGNQYDLISEQWSNSYQPMISGTIDQFKGMAGQILDQFKDLIIGTNFDKIIVNIRIPHMKLEVDVNLTINGLNDFIKTFLDAYTRKKK